MHPIIKWFAAVVCAFGLAIMCAWGWHHFHENKLPNPCDRSCATRAVAELSHKPQSKVNCEEKAYPHITLDPVSDYDRVAYPGGDRSAPSKSTYRSGWRCTVGNDVWWVSKDGVLIFGPHQDQPIKTPTPTKEPKATKVPTERPEPTPTSTPSITSGGPDNGSGSGSGGSSGGSQPQPPSDGGCASCNQPIYSVPTPTPAPAEPTSVF